MMLGYFNPYTDQDFFGFFATLCERIFSFCCGKTLHLAADELQLIVLSCVAATSALVGTFLVARRQSMLANALSHTILLGIVAAFLLFSSLTLPALMLAALFTALVTCFLTDFLSRIIKLQEDASIGLIFTILFAVGIILLTFFGRDSHMGTELVMGNADALQKEDITLSLFVLLFNACIFFLFYRGFKITTFDGHLAKMLGFSPAFFSYMLILLASLSTISSFRSVGVLMAVAFFILPPLTARLLTHKLYLLIALAAMIGGCVALCGVALSRHILTFYGVGVSTGGLIVTLLGLCYAVVILIKASLTFRRGKAMLANRVRGLKT